VALALLASAQLMLVLDVTVVNVALPDIGAALHLQRGELPWVMTIYTVFFGGLMLLGGRIADLFGARRMTLAGLALFTAASLLCGLSGDAATLLAGRSLQGLGAALMSPAALARAARSAVAPASRFRATRNPMTAPSSTPMTSVSSEIRGMSPYLQQAMTVPIRHADRRPGRALPGNAPESSWLTPPAPGLLRTPEPAGLRGTRSRRLRSASRVPRNPARSGRRDHFVSVRRTNSPEPVVAALSVPVKIVCASNCLLLLHEAPM